MVVIHILRSDSADYEHDLLNYFKYSGSILFGRIEFAIGCDMVSELIQAL